MATTMANHNQPTTTMMPLSRKPSADSFAPLGGAGTNHGNNNGGGGGLSLTLSSKPTLITTQSLRFLIMDAPRQSNLHLYIKECKRHHVTDIVRVCEPTYLGAELKNAGMTLHEMAYEDGQSPSEEVLTKWLALVEERFFSENKSSDASATIAVHCVAGLGRAPVLVAIALMEFESMDAVEAVMMIRKNRRGAINEKQLQYLEGYKCRMRKGGGGCGCAIM